MLALKAEGLTNVAIAKGIGKSDAALGEWLRGRYAGNNKALEASITQWLRDRQVARVSGVPTIDTEISRSMSKRIEEIRVKRTLGVLIGVAGIGKSRGRNLWVSSHDLAIDFRAVAWDNGINGVRAGIMKAAEITRAVKGQTPWQTINAKTTGSGRPLIVDDAHELTQRALQCCVDWHEETGNPVVLIGLPELEKRLMPDARRASRVDYLYPLKVKDPLPLLTHLIDRLAPDINGERDDLTGLCLQVAAHDGAFRAVEKQLQRAALNRSKKAGLNWVDAFRAAHQRLPRNYKLN